MVSSTLPNRPAQEVQAIHPALWRASQLARPAQPIISSGFPALDRQLPGNGWPLGSLIELFCGPLPIGEMQLLQPGLSQLNPAQRIVLLNSPFQPNALCHMNIPRFWQRVLCIQPETPRLCCWAAEQILRHNACAALLFWLPPRTPPGILRKLHVTARQGHTLFIGLNSAAPPWPAGAAPLRLQLLAAAQGLSIRFIKRQGPQLEDLVHLDLGAPFSTISHWPVPGSQPAIHHGSLDHALFPAHH